MAKEKRKKDKKIETEDDVWMIRKGRVKEREIKEK